ncbi:hypothetical protein E4631_24200 [Hymenobacter sp. UV11]|uniref:hypothetical protein n=1 Tax=Hymenobacter sp. UV11 TaxID=1849735 RepID=UPI00105E42AB|nr:hypothetical protein [Hymenobacter sp. UV11]TDN39148.1 hypothetical protein A8B98_20430 [Hymenobacter sp. UV11]TFZ62917.1 hypothetical protein E4631_24200 [Hymenobacter sp. UV11]
MTYSSQQVLILLAVVPNVVAALLAALKWRRLPISIRPLAILTVFALLTEIISRVLWLLKLSNLFLLPIYISVEFGLLVWLYSQAIDRQWIMRLRWPLTVGLGVLAILEEQLKLPRAPAYNNLSRLMESASIIVLALAYYHSALRQPKTAYIWREPLFWVSTGLLFFFTGSFLIYTVTNFAFYYHRPLVMQLWVVHAGLDALLYTTYAYALWLSLKT